MSSRLLPVPLIALLLAAAPLHAQIPPQAVWPLPVVPSGNNAALVAAPRVDWVTRVEETVRQTRGKHFDLIFDGDSITDGWQGRGRPVWDALYVPLNAVDYGIGGDRIENVLWRLQQGEAEGTDPKLVVLLIGTNNSGRDSAEQIAAGIKAVVSAYLERCPHARLLLLGIFPRSAQPTDPIRAKITDVNHRIAALDDGGKRVTFLDIGAKFLEPDGTISAETMGDFLHPSLKGYHIWANAMAAEIGKTFPNAPKDLAPEPALGSQ
jgi:lysophospholipase L1-like esterase